MLFFFVSFLLIVYINSNGNSIIYAKSDGVIQNVALKENIIGSKKLTINDTFSMEGSLLSTIIFNNKNISTYSNNTAKDGSLQNTDNSISKRLTNLTDMKPIGSSNISDNLVSLLSDIIIESLNNGNPTLSNINNSLNSKDKNNNVNLIFGSWKLDVQKGIVTNFEAKYEMIALDGMEYHMYLLNNLTSTEKLFFGNDYSTVINGKLNLFAGTNNSSKEIADVLFSINNLELIQIKFLDKASANHFNDYSLYGTIDSINIKN